MLMNLFKTLVRVLQTLNTCLKPLRMPTQFKDFHQNPCEAASKSKIMLKTLAYSSTNGKGETLPLKPLRGCFKIKDNA